MSIELATAPATNCETSSETDLAAGLGRGVRAGTSVPVEPVIGIRPVPRSAPPALSWAVPRASITSIHPELPWQSPPESSSRTATGAAEVHPRRGTTEDTAGIEVDLLPFDDGGRREGSDASSETAGDPAFVRPDPQAWSSWLAQLIVEVIQGRRPPGQLARWAEERVLATVILRTRQLRLERARGEGPPVDGPPHGQLRGQRSRPVPGRRSEGRVPTPRSSLGSVRIQQPTRGSVEASAVIRGPHCSAMAFRLEARGDRWLCTAVDFGPQTPQAA